MDPPVLPRIPEFPLPGSGPQFPLVPSIATQSNYAKLVFIGVAFYFKVCIDRNFTRDGMRSSSQPKLPWNRWIPLFADGCNLGWRLSWMNVVCCITERLLKLSWQGPTLLRWRLVLEMPRRMWIGTRLSVLSKNHSLLDKAGMVECYGVPFITLFFLMCVLLRWRKLFNKYFSIFSTFVSVVLVSIINFKL